MSVFKGVIEVGARVSCSLHYAGYGYVTAIHGEQAPDTVRAVGGVMVTGGGARFDIVFDNGASSSKLSEAILRGSVQWKIHSNEPLATGAQIAAAVAYSEQVKAEEIAAAESQAVSHVNEVERLKNATEWSHLEQGDDRYSGVLAAKNIRAILRREFKGVKFSVRKSSYGSLTISWTDGPLAAAVESKVLSFKRGSFDSMQDIYTDSGKAWNEVFGGAEYVSTYREISDDLIEKAISNVVQEYAGNLRDGGIERPTVQNYRSGNLFYVQVPGVDDLQRLIRTTAHAMHV